MTDERVTDDDARADDAADVELQALLSRAAQSPTVHRERVHDAAEQALARQADVLRRLRDNDGNDADVDDGAAWVERMRTGRRLRDAIGHDDNTANPRQQSSESATAAHLGSAKEFFAAAEQAHGAGLLVAATANAVLSGTHSASAICLQLTGKTAARGDPAEDLTELAASGVDTAHVVVFGRLLQAGAGSDAGEAVGWAGQLLEAAEDVMRGNDGDAVDSAPDGWPT